MSVTAHDEASLEHAVTLTGGPQRGAALAVPVVGAVVAAACLYLAVSTSGFLTVDNFKAILASVPTIGIVAIGMTIVILGGNLFSLSLAATMAVAAMAFVGTLHVGWPVALLLTLGVGVVSGAAQGGLVGGAGANPIIVTLAASSLLEGLGLLFTHGNTVRPHANDSYHLLTSDVSGIPFSVFVLFALWAAMSWITRRTRFGHELYFVGDNRAAARAAGLPVTWNTVLAFSLAGGCAALAGALLGASTGSVTLSIEGTVTFDAFAAVLVGGTALAGGSGSVTRSVAGTLLIAVITNLLLLRGYSTGVQIACKGGLVFAVMVAMYIRDRGRV